MIKSKSAAILEETNVITWSKNDVFGDSPAEKILKKTTN